MIQPETVRQSTAITVAALAVVIAFALLPVGLAIAIAVLAVPVVRAVR